MSKIKYVDTKFSKSSLDIIEKANQIIEEYAAQGFDLTLRQLYYQFVSRDLIPNKQSEYKRLGNIINDARLAGLIDWSRITDRTRNLRGLSHWDNPGDIIKSAAHSFQIDKWAYQHFRVEVWIEKDALVGVIEGICNDLDINYFSCRGYTSQSEMWAAAQRIIRHHNRGQKTIILHFGDHDPSGIDMSRDITERLELFTNGGFEVHRLALNMNQIDEYSPPPNPAKTTDSRCEGYIRNYGYQSWELDALEPRVISNLIRDAVFEYRDIDLWERDCTRENQEIESLKKAALHWDEVERHLKNIS